MGKEARVERFTRPLLPAAPRCGRWQDVDPFAPGLRPLQLRLGIELALVEAHPVLEDKDPAGWVCDGFHREVRVSVIASTTSFQPLGAKAGNLQ
jgi:hypothetical protein